MSRPETINDGNARRIGANTFAQAVATALTGQGLPVQNWWVDLLGGVHMTVRMGGGAERIFEFSASLPNQPFSQALVLARFNALEAHVS